MKIVSAFILAIIVLISVSAHAQERPDRKGANLAGAVKTVSERFDRYADGKLEQGDTVTYSSAGMEVERVMYSDYGQPIGKRTITHDTLGNVRTILNFAETGKLRGESKFVYFAGKLTEIREFDGAGNLLLTFRRSHDKDGKLAEEFYEGALGRPGKTIFTYDAKGQLSEVAFFLPNGKKANGSVGPCLGGHRVAYEYDSEGRMIKRSVFEDDGTEKRTWSYAYDGRGNLSVYLVKSGQSASSWVYTYLFDDRGNWTRRTAVIDLSGKMIDIQRAMTEALTPKGEQPGDITKRTEITHRTITYF